MTDAEINSFLEREIIEKNNTVTFRLLSRKLPMHVNAAKNALAAFHAQKRESSQPVYATFWVAGETNGRQKNATGDEMDVDDEKALGWQERTAMLVSEPNLENVKATFSKIHALYVYALSASSLHDSSKLCGSSRDIRETDMAGGDALAAIVGKVTTQHVKRASTVGESTKASSSAKNQTSTSAKAQASTLKPANVPVPTKPKTEEKPQVKLPPPAAAKEKPKATGKLDWSKAKPKEVKKAPSEVKSTIKAKDVKKTTATDNQEIRGVKRKSAVMSQKQEEEPVKTKAERMPLSRPLKQEGSDATRVTNGVVVSDDEEGETVAKSKSARKGRFNAVGDDSDTERSLRAMMDVDDSEVIKASRPAPQTSPQEEEEEEEEPPKTDDAAMDEDTDDPAPKTKPRKRKVKKPIPVGRNGYKKKRVVKSKTDLDAKGYMVTVDYSSYESVNEEEGEAALEKEKAAKSKGKAKTKKAPAEKKPSTAKKSVPSESEAEAKTSVRSQSPALKKAGTKKPSARPSAPKGRLSGGGQKSLTSFFGAGGGEAKK